MALNVSTTALRHLSQMYATWGVSVSQVGQSSASLDFKTGSQSLVESVAAAVAIRGNYTLADLAAGGGQLQMGDVWFDVRVAQVADPDRADQIVDGSETFRVVGWVTKTLELEYRFQCRKG